MGNKKRLNSSINLVVFPQVYMLGHTSHWYSSIYLPVSLDHLAKGCYSEHPDSFSCSQMKTTTQKLTAREGWGLSVDSVTLSWIPI